MEYYAKNSFSIPIGLNSQFLSQSSSSMALIGQKKYQMDSCPQSPGKKGVLKL